MGTMTVMNMGILTLMTTKVERTLKKNNFMNKCHMKNSKGFIKNQDYMDLVPQTYTTRCRQSVVGEDCPSRPHPWRIEIEYDLEE